MKETIVLRSDNFCIVEGKDAPKPFYALETSLDFPFLKDLGDKEIEFLENLEVK